MNTAGAASGFGYGFANSDLPRLAALHAAHGLPGASLCHARAVVDLGRAESQLGRDKLISGGLNTLVRARLGCRLDKSEQCSAWGERPLSAAQLHTEQTGPTCLAFKSIQ